MNSAENSLRGRSDVVGVIKSTVCRIAEEDPHYVSCEQKVRQLLSDKIKATKVASVLRRLENIFDCCEALGYARAEWKAVRILEIRRARYIYI